MKRVYRHRERTILIKWEGSQYESLSSKLGVAENASRTCLVRQCETGYIHPLGGLFGAGVRASWRRTGDHTGRRILCVTVMQAETEAYEEELLSEPECVVSSAMRKSFFLKPRRFKARNLPSSGQERQLTTTLTGEPMKC